MAVCLMALAACGCGVATPLEGVYQTESHTRGPCSGPFEPTGFDLNFALTKGKKDGEVAFALSNCSGLTADTCALGAFRFRKLDDAWGFQGASAAGGSATESCTLSYTVWRLHAEGRRVTITERTHYAHEPTLTMDCTAAEAERRGTSMECVALETWVGELVD